MRRWMLAFVAIAAAMTAGQAAAQRDPTLSDDPSDILTGILKDTRREAATTPIVTSGWLATPTAAEVQAAFPMRAAAEELEATVSLLCAVDGEGLLSVCRVVEEKPAGYGFGAAALVLSARYKAPRTQNGRPVAGGVIRVPMTFKPTQAKVNEAQLALSGGGDGPPPTVAAPEWLRRPTPADIAAKVPVRAATAGRDGEASLLCQTTVDGYLRACKTETESVAGFGFGQAALELADQFVMKPPEVDGRPAEAQVRVTLAFRAADAAVAGGADVAAVPAGPIVLTDPQWAATPSAAAMRAAWPLRAGTVAEGDAVLRCRVDARRALQACQVTSETPAGAGFGDAARSLASRFRLDPSTPIRDVLVEAPFRFRNPNAPPAPITTPRWILTLSPRGAEVLFPQAARASGVLTGVGYVDCAATAQGELADCRLDHDEPAGLGFGASALEAAKVMAMSPWTRDGEPVEGRRLVVPIRFRLTLSEPPPATPTP